MKLKITIEESKNKYAYAPVSLQRLYKRTRQLHALATTLWRFTSLRFGVVSIPLVDEYLQRSNVILENIEQKYPELARRIPCQHMGWFGSCRNYAIGVCPFCFGVYCVMHTNHGDKTGGHIGYSA